MNKANHHDNSMDPDGPHASEQLLALVYDELRRLAAYKLSKEKPGQTLQALVASGWRPDDDELVGIARQLLGVCAYLSGLRPPVVHRDIKPSNVLYDVETRQLSLVDFGAVAAAAASATSGSTMGGLGSTVVGTFGYMAPEQFQGGGSTSTDLYSVGATLLFVLTGRSPDEWPKTRLRIDLKGVAMGSALARAVPALLEPFPEDRVRSATEALALLDGTAAQFTGNGASEEDGAADRPGVIGGRQFARSSASSGAYAMGAPTSPATSVAPASPPRRRRRPSGARTTIERSDAQLVVRIPAGGLTASSGGNVAFSVAWNSFIAFWTVGAFTGGGPLFAAFSLPFWLAGAQMGGKAVRSIAMKTEMELRPNRFSLARNLGGREIGMLEGATADLAPLRAAPPLPLGRPSGRTRRSRSPRRALTRVLRRIETCCLLNARNSASSTRAGSVAKPRVARTSTSAITA